VHTLRFVCWVLTKTMSLSLQLQRFFLKQIVVDAQPSGVPALIRLPPSWPKKALVRWPVPFSTSACHRHSSMLPNADFRIDSMLLWTCEWIAHKVSVLMM
jgi:hypothetical protein